MTTTTQPKLFPVQSFNNSRQCYVPEPVYMAAYEVYSAVYAPQKEMIEGDCRGGFAKGELVAYLYARGFPRTEWRVRVEEAFKGMSQL